MEMFRRAGPERRLEMTLQLCEGARQLARDGIRHRHPEYTARQVEWAWRRLMLKDDALFQKVWPEGPIYAA